MGVSRPGPPGTAPATGLRDREPRGTPLVSTPAGRRASRGRRDRQRPGGAHEARSASAYPPAPSRDLPGARGHRRGADRGPGGRGAEQADRDAMRGCLEERVAVQGPGHGGQAPRTRSPPATSFGTPCAARHRGVGGPTITGRASRVEEKDFTSAGERSVGVISKVDARCRAARCCRGAAWLHDYGHAPGAQRPRPSSRALRCAAWNCSWWR